MTRTRAEGATAMALFHELREDLPAVALATLKTDVRSYFDHLVATQRRNELVAVDLAELLCVRLETLLAMAHQLAPAARGDIVGAARYFISEDDAVPDDRSCTGLDDDVEVFNHVAVAIGRPDLVIAD